MGAAAVDDAAKIVVLVKEHIAGVYVQMTQWKGAPDSILDDQVAQSEFQDPACREPF